MKKKLLLSTSFIKKVQSIKSKDHKLYQKIKKQLALFQSNPTHPSLRTHKLTGNLSQVWSISATRSIRLLYIEDTQSYYFFDLGTHDQVYKK